MDRKAVFRRLQAASSELKALNKVRGPLGHGVIYIADKAAQQELLRAEIAALREMLRMKQ